MKNFFSLLLALLPLFLCSCSHENDPSALEITPASLIGTTFTDGAFFITIEENSMVSFYTREYPDIKGRAEYNFRHGIFEVINPYGKRLPANEVTKAYILYLEGTFTQYGKLDCDYVVVGPYEKAQMQGGTNMWKLEKEK